MHKGTCLCGAVAFELTAPPRGVTHCHCSRCRKAHGAAFSSYAAVPRRALHLLKGQDALAAYRSSEDIVRYFCRHCGSALLLTKEQHVKDWISVALACLDTPLPQLSQQHTHVWSKLPWYRISDGFPQHRYGAPPRTRAQGEA